MSFRAAHRYARISPRKVRPLADMIRGRFADEALDILRYQPHRGARMLEKVLRSALGNAQDPDQNPGQTIRVDRLVVVDARVDGGPMFKRMRPRARGMAFLIKKRTSHIHVALEDINEL
ncbi:MAG: 50S ribosomal protein L22 [Planctomycetaceae bacterium]|nr:50S ribosomal protein L22 [Planctomycetaceae bacterium]